MWQSCCCHRHHEGLLTAPTTAAVLLEIPPSSLMICFGRNSREMILFCGKSCWGWCSTLHYWKQWPLFTIIAILHLKLLSFWVFSINTCNGTTHVLSPRSHCSTTFFLLSFGSSSSSHTQSMYTLCYFPQKYFKIKSTFYIWFLISAVLTSNRNYYENKFEFKFFWKKPF